jgi:hypothetical protein
MEEHDQVFRACTRILSGFFVLGGRRDLAERVRPSVRRRRQPAVPPEGEGETTAPPEPPAEPAETAPTS